MNFNSIKVRLKLSTDPALTVHIINFNSIKVRLKLCCPCCSLNDKQFQFHKGTIKTKYEIIDPVALTNFNSIKVRLKLSTDPALTVHIINFNSIKVRLKLCCPCCSLNDKQFQFHKGTIKTKYEIIDPVALTNFNSIKVRLKPFSQSADI